MSVIRVDLNKCIGCRNCVDICPMDVFYFEETAYKSVLAYPENCQSCGQCYLNCQGRALGTSNDSFGYPITAYRGATTAPMNRLASPKLALLRSLQRDSCRNTHSPFLENL